MHDEIVPLLKTRGVTDAQIETVLGSVEIWDSRIRLGVIQAVDGTLYFDRRPVGEDAAALFGQAYGPWAKRDG